MSAQNRVIAFAASNSRNSINKRLVQHAIAVLRSELSSETDTELLELNDFEMPIYSPEREKADGVPELAQEFFRKMGSADGLLISFAEHNGSYTAAFKNLFDWCSRIQKNVYQDKPILMLSTSPGRRGGQNVLRTAVDAAPHFGGKVTASMSVGPFGEHFDSERGCIRTPEAATELRAALQAFCDALPGK